MTKKQIIIDGVDVSGCYQYMPRYMEDYDIDTLDYCRYHFKPCKDVDVKYCYYKQLKRKEQKLERVTNMLFTGQCSNCEGYSPNCSNKELCNFKHNIKNIIDEVENAR